MAYQLNAIGGTNYLGALDTTLVTDTKCTADTYTLDNFETAELVVEMNNAVSAGASISSDINVLSGLIACLNNASLAQLKAAELQLRCKLGRAKTYPQ